MAWYYPDYWCANELNQRSRNLALRHLVEHTNQTPDVRCTCKLCEQARHVLKHRKIK